MSAPTKTPSKAPSKAATKAGIPTSATATTDAPIAEPIAAATKVAAKGSTKVPTKGSAKVPTTAAAKAPKKCLSPTSDLAAGVTEEELAEAAKKRAAAARKAKKRERAAEEDRLAEQIRLAEEAVAGEDAKGLGISIGFGIKTLGTRTRWMVGAVLAVLIFQVVHSAEHVAQATYWLFNPGEAPWMSAWAMGLTNALGAASGGGVPLGMELLHLIGNAIFLGGLLLAARLPDPYRNPSTLKWLRLATIVQALHFAEHVLLTTSMALFGKALGVSTLFGLLSAGTPAATGYRVLFHLIVNVVAITLALKAALAVRGVTASTKTRIGWIGYAILAAPLAGLVFLIPVFGAHAPHSAAADPAAIAATVNGEDITSSDVEAAVQITLARPNAPLLGTVGASAENLTDEQLRFATLNQLVQKRLTEQGAAALGITLTDAEIDARKAELIGSDFLGQEAYDQFLADNNVTDEYATEQVRGLLLQERVHAQLTEGAEFTPEEVDARFTAVYEGFPRALQLLTENEASANALLARAEAGADFPELIRTESADPRAATTGGNTGPIQEDAAVPELVAAVNSIEEGGFAVVQTQYGWHVIQRLAPATLAEAEAEIRASLLLERQATAGQEWLRTLRDAATITLAPGYGVWDTEYGAVVPSA